MRSLPGMVGHQPPVSVPQQIANIKAWTRAAFALEDGAIVSVNELACSQPDCPSKQTVVLVLVKGVPAIRFALHKDLFAIDQTDIQGVRSRPIDSGTDNARGQSPYDPANNPAMGSSSTT